MPESQDVTIRGDLLLLDAAHSTTELDIQFGEADAQAKLLELAKAAAPDPEVFDRKPPFFYFAEISNDIVNCYYLSFQRPMLESWVDTLKDGVQFQAFHQNSAPLGHSIYGWAEKLGDRERVIGAFYTIPDVQINMHMDTSSFIDSVKSGVLRDVSVGMFAEEVECNICGGDPTDWIAKLFGESDCEHWLGEQYPITDAEGKQTGETVTCIGLVHKGQLNEVSQVYKGGAPMAGIIPAMQLSREKGLLDPVFQAKLENRFGINGVGGNPVAALGSGVATSSSSQIMPSFVSVSSLKKKEASMPEPTVAEVELSIQTISDMLTERQLARLSEMEIELSGDDGFGFADVIDAMIDRIDRLEDRSTSLEADAQIGREHKSSLIDDAISLGIRAKGNEWNADEYRKLLEHATVAQIKLVRDDFQKEGDARLAPKNSQATRLTTDGSDLDKVTEPKAKEKFNDPRYS